ncbi:MAG: T9SS type A sorting domain-containing protein [Melioribacteraceae bacterium]|nr:T9SS type A sorting domain-containing protein [Melioribacteraceae bacterium]
MLIFSISTTAQDYERLMVSVPKVDSGAITIDGVMDEAEWETAGKADLVTSTGYNIWANKYYRESLAEPEFDELYGRMLWNNDTLYVFIHIDEFVNDSTGLFFNGKWAADQLFVSISNQLGIEMKGWYDGNGYAAPEGPYHLWILGDQVTLNGGDTTYVPDEYRGCPEDSLMTSPDPSQFVRSAVKIDETNGVMDVELAIYNPNVAAQGKIGFNLGGSNGSQAAYDEFFDAYQYYTWQPSVPNDPWAAPAGADPGFYNLASSSHWAILYFEPGNDDILREVVEVPKTDSGAVQIDGVMSEAAWDNAGEVNLITSTGYNIWANKYYRESLAEPEFDELYGKLLWYEDTLYVYMHIDEFVNDSTGLFFNGKWSADQLFVSLSSNLGRDMMGWYDGNGYAAPGGPYHLWILGEDVTLNGGDTTYIPDIWRSCPTDSQMVAPDPTQFGRYAATVDPATGIWTVEMAIYNPHVAYQSSIAFNVGGSNGSQAAYDEFFDAYQYYTWQPSVPNDPWAAPAEADPGFYNLANSSRWAMLNFVDELTVGVNDELDNSQIPTRIELQQNYPNPFNPTTTITYNIPEASNVSIKVYDVLGKLVANLVDNQMIDAGVHQVNWNAKSLSSGIYFYELRVENVVQTKKMMLLK